MPPEEKKKPIHMHDIVRLKSGGPEMYVISQKISYDNVGHQYSAATVVYSDADGNVHRTTLDTRQLTFVRRIES
jgi:hypothetical protein